jgi:DNA-binding NarL/FixJ family response regulator
MDIAMPRMDGLAATRELKARFPAARIVILTQYDEALLRAAAQAAGACGYLLKENLSEVPGWIATHSAAGPSPECHPPGEAPVMQPTAPGKP